MPALTSEVCVVASTWALLTPAETSMQPFVTLSLLIKRIFNFLKELCLVWQLSNLGKRKVLSRKRKLGLELFFLRYACFWPYRTFILCTLWTKFSSLNCAVVTTTSASFLHATVMLLSFTGIEHRQKSLWPHLFAVVHSHSEWIRPTVAHGVVSILNEHWRKGFWMFWILWPSFIG